MRVPTIEKTRTTHAERVDCLDFGNMAHDVILGLAELGASAAEIHEVHEGSTRTKLNGRVVRVGCRTVSQQRNRVRTDMIARDSIS